MRARYLTILDKIRGSYWFIPSLMTSAAVALSFITTALDRSLADDVIEEVGYIYTGGPEGARELFGTVAGSMITVAGVTFSITIVALTLASQQFGPRLLHNFMRDRANQLVLGTFVSTFIYCLLMLRTVRGGEDQSFVPHVSATTAVGLALIGVGVLIFFIHHVSTQIQVSTVIATVGADLDRSIEHLYPKQLGPHPGEGEVAPANARAELPAAFPDEAVALPAQEVGYLQMIENERLMQCVVKYDLVVRVEQRPGKFVSPGVPLAWVWPPGRVNSHVLDALRDCIVVGHERTKLQDTEFSVSQLVEIACRALSPGINDPTTATMCVERLGASLQLLASRDMPSSYRYDEEGHLRLIVDAPSFRGLADAAFNEIRQYGVTAVPVVIRMLEVIARIAEEVRTDEQRDTLMRHAIMLQRQAQKIPEELDRGNVEERFQRVLRMLRGQSDSAELTLPRGADFRSGESPEQG